MKRVSAELQNLEREQAALKDELFHTMDQIFPGQDSAWVDLPETGMRIGRSKRRVGKITWSLNDLKQKMGDYFDALVDFVPQVNERRLSDLRDILSESDKELLDSCRNTPSYTNYTVHQSLDSRYINGG